MSKKMQGKVVMITGAADGQGRAHAVRMAEEGADIAILDLCVTLDSTPYGGPSKEDLEETARLVRELGSQVHAAVVDVRDAAGMQAFVSDVEREIGTVDVLIAQAGICTFGKSWEMSEEHWDETVDINLKGAWLSAKYVIPAMIEKRSGVLLFTSSAAALTSFANLSHYSAAKGGLVSMVDSMAGELGEFNIRVNTIHPGNVSTRMVHNGPTYELFAGRPDAPVEQIAAEFQKMHMLPIPWQEPRDIANAALFLASDEARYITSVHLPVDAGLTRK